MGGPRSSEKQFKIGRPVWGSCEEDTLLFTPGNLWIPHVRQFLKSLTNGEVASLPGHGCMSCLVYVRPQLGDAQGPRRPGLMALWVASSLCSVSFLLLEMWLRL